MRVKAILFWSMGLLATPLMAQEERDIHLGQGWRLRWNPRNDLYPRYVADPRRSRHILSISNAIDPGIPGAGELRWPLCIGGDYPLARLFRDGAPESGWQFDVEARFFTQFDIENDLDELGHDGRLGMIISKGFGEDLAARLTVNHTSSHIGDEYLLRHDIRERLSARKEEIGGGISWKLREGWRTYGDVGYGLNLGIENEPLRIQWGLEYETRPVIANGRWYAGLDITAFEENDWDPSTNLQLGIVFPFPSASRWYRFGVEFYDGRAHLDSFFMHRERYLILGAWLDL